MTIERETVEMKENMSYGPVKLQSQTATQEPVYEEADILQQVGDVHTGGNVAYGHISSWLAELLHCTSYYISVLCSIAVCMNNSIYPDTYILWHVT